MPNLDVRSDVTGTVWKVEKTAGDAVEKGDVIMILESMKMEIPVEAPGKGKIVEILVSPEDSVDEEQVLCMIEA